MSIDNDDIEYLGDVHEIEAICADEGNGDWIDITMYCPDEKKTILVTLGAGMARELLTKLSPETERAEANNERINALFE
jgi:hypothetical protein